MCLRAASGFEEGELPLLLVLVGILAGVWAVDRHAESLSDRVVVIRIDPANVGWRPDRIGDGTGDGDQEAEVVEPSGKVPAAVAEARRLAKSGDLQAAEAALRSEVARDPHGAVARNDLAVHLMRTDRAEEAIRWLEAAIAASPGCRCEATSGGRSRRRNTGCAHAVAPPAILLRAHAQSLSRHRSWGP